MDQSIQKTDWWVRVVTVGINSLLSSIFAFSTDLRTKTPHSLFCNFRAPFTTRWSGSRVQAWGQVRAPACHLAITPQGCLRKQLKVLTEKSIDKLLGQRSSTAWAGQTGKHKQSMFSSLQWLLTSTCSLEGNVLPLLLC